MELKPSSGERLPGERELAVRLSLGRRALRRALDSLEQEGLIWRLQGSGTFYGQPSMLNDASASIVSEMNSPEEVMLFRTLIEPAMCRIAAVRASSAQLDEINYCLERVMQAVDPLGFDRWDARFHDAIARASNHRLMAMLSATVLQLRSSAPWSELRREALSEDRREKSNQQHLAIYSALVMRHADQADEAMRSHMRSVYISHFEDSLGTGEPR